MTPEALYRSAFDCASAELLCGGTSWGASEGASGALRATTRRRRRGSADGTSVARDSLAGRAAQRATRECGLAHCLRGTPHRTGCGDASARMTLPEDNEACGRDSRTATGLGAPRCVLPQP